MTQRVLVDANVLFSKTLMDWLFHLRTHNDGMFQLYATEDILAEVLANMREKKPSAPGALTRHRLGLMRSVLDEILQDFPGQDDPRAAPFTGRDPQDYHVHAAACAGRAALIVTANDPRDITGQPEVEPYEIITPDDFFCLVATSNPSCLDPIVRRQLAYWCSRPAQRQLDDALRRAGCDAFAGQVRTALQRLARKEA